MTTLGLRAAVLGLALAASGCVMPCNDPGDLRREIESTTGKEYDRTLGLTVGRTGMALTRWAVRKWGDEEIPLEGIRKVEIGIYEASDDPGTPANGSALSASMWPDSSLVVEMHGDDGENVLILSEARRDGSIRRLVFFVEDGDELAIVRLTGRLDHLIEQAIAYALKEAERPDLVDPAIEEYRRTGQD